MVSIQPPVDRLALGAALLTVVLWASAFVGIRAAGEELSPGSITFGRMLIGTLVLGLLVAVRPWRPPGRRDLVLIVASGLIWFAFYNVVLNEAERNVDAGTASMLVNMGPILIAVLAGLFLNEGLPPRLFAGCAVALVGTTIIGVGTSDAPVAGGDTTWGIVLCLVAALAYAAGITLQKPVLRSVAALHVTWLACVTGLVVTLPFAPGLVAELTTAEGASVAWLIYLGLFPTSIAVTAWAFALGRTSAGRLGAMTYLIPPVVIVMSWLLLSEVPTPIAIAGGALCVGGVMIARSTGRPWDRRQPAAAPAADAPVE